MNILTIVASNKDRLQLNHKPSEFFVKSIQWQDFKDFELLIADGGSSNYNEVKDWLEHYDGPIKMRIIQSKIDLFSRSYLNNIGIRNATTEYAASTDADMLFARDFMYNVSLLLRPNTLIESRTMYWKLPLVDKIYSGKLDPYKDIDSCKIGRIKKRTSAGGFQCMDVKSWDKLHGFDEKYLVWGSEDYDLLTRAQMARLNIKWMGENNDIRLFHQPHAKKDIKMDLAWQAKNKKLLNNIKDYRANLNIDWGKI